MSCCPQSITSFAGVSVTNVHYNGEYGAEPTVTVVYYQDGAWRSQGVATGVSLIGTPVNTVRVDHGGPATGIIKLS